MKIEMDAPSRPAKGNAPSRPAIEGLLLGLLATFLMVACGSKPQPPLQNAADLVILDAAISTMNAAQAEARALAIKDGKIAYVGDEQQAQGWIGKDTKVLRLKGVSVWPGLIDSHIHLMEGSLTLDSCSFEDKPLKLPDIGPIIRQCAERTPGDGWLTLQNLNAAGFQAVRQDLDAIVPKRPLFLFSADGHVGWANTAALKRAGIDRKTPDPAGGRIEHDRSGEPTGFLIDMAVNLLSSKLEQPTEEQRERMLLRALHDLTADGVTSFMEANTSAETVHTYVELARKNQLHSRVTLALGSEGETTDEEFARLKELRTLAESQPPLRADMIKLFNDGIMEYPTQTAAMLEPYLDAKGKPTKNLGPLYHETGPSHGVRESGGQGRIQRAHPRHRRSRRPCCPGCIRRRARPRQQALVQHRAPRADRSHGHSAVQAAGCDRLVPAAMGAAGQLQRGCSAALHRTGTSGAPVPSGLVRGGWRNHRWRQRLERVHIQSVRSDSCCDLACESERAPARRSRRPGAEGHVA